MSNQNAMLLAAASQFSFAVSDLVEAARYGDIQSCDNLGGGDTLTVAVDGLRLMIEILIATPAVTFPGDEEEQLLGALIRYLDDLT